MPLDRRITIERNYGDVNMAGEFVDDWRELAGVWAQQAGAGAVDADTDSGVVTTAVRNYTVRWRSDLQSLSPSVLRIRDNSGAIWEVDVVSESDARRRFLTIQCIREVAD